jgi:putative membrane protein
VRTDLLLAVLHHLFVFGLAAILATEAALLREAPDAPRIERLAQVDAGFGIAAAMVLVVGLCRVWFGVKGADFYLHNPWFHAKLGAFVLVGLLSIWPTVRFLRWRRAARADAGFRPGAAELARVRGFVRVELALLGAIFALAAAMARYGGF